MATPRVKASQCSGKLAADGCLIGGEQQRIEIALQRHPGTNRRAGAGEIALPVHTQTERAPAAPPARRHGIEAVRRATTEHDHRQRREFGVQACHDPLHGRQRIVAVQPRRQYAAPGVEQHQRIGAGLHLPAQVRGDSIDVDVEYPLEEIGARQQHAPGDRKPSPEPPPSIM